MPSPVTFFDYQERAKARSHWALLGFALTVILTAAAVSLFGGFVGSLLLGTEAEWTSREAFWLSARFSAAACLGIIFLSWAFRAAGLSAGPAAVMSSMGAWHVPPDSREPDQRQLLNIVEEMAIASGVPMPDVYIIDDAGINACAVGMEIDHAAVAVTRGAVVKLNRNELQGVIAHEFSHILHGDMALNTQMIAWLAGLFTLSEIGRILMSLFEDDSDSWFSGIGNRRGAPVAIIIGGGIWLLGGIGVFFGKLLQAGLSRQREYLADASAVQYTRHPEGLANALRKLGAHSARGRMRRSPSDCGHLMFANLRPRDHAGIFSTHPPLPARIRRILPAWDGSYLETLELEIPRHEGYVQPPSLPPQPPETARNLSSTLVLLNLLEAHRMPETALLSSVAAWKASLNPALLQAARDPQRACALIYTLLLTPAPEKGLQVLKGLESETVLSEIETLRRASDFTDRDRLGLLDLALPALRMLDPPEKQSFLRKVSALTEADGHIDLFEYCLQKILHQALRAPGTETDHHRMRVHISNLETEINIMLSALSRLGAADENAAARSFARAEERMLGFTAGIQLRLLPAGACGLEALDQACERLPGLNPNFQRRLLLAGLAAIAADDQLQPEELQAFRAFAAVLRIPVPPGLGFANPADSAQAL